MMSRVPLLTIEIVRTCGMRTVSLSLLATSWPWGAFEVTEPVLSTLPASMSVWVITYVAVHVAVSAGSRVAAVAGQAKATGTTTIFFETLVSPKVAETIAREVGARTAVLDPLEGLTVPDADYFSVMRSNLTALTAALGCTS